MKQITVNANDAGQRLDKLLAKLLHDAPKSLIYKWLRKKRVKVNGKKQDARYMLCEGDVLELYINDEFFSAPSVPDYLTGNAVINAVYEDENIIIINKPSGLAVHGGGENSDNLVRRLQAYLFQKGEYDPRLENSFAPSLCNRIDRNTTGLVIAAKNAAALRILNEKIRLREVKKYYLLKTEGIPNLPSGAIEGYTVKDERENKVYFYREPHEGAKHCVTRYRTLDADGTVEALLETGRTHQIRASFAAIGCPLEGDVKYGAAKNGGHSFQALKAYKIEFDFTSPSGRLEYLNGKIFCI